MGSNLGDRLGFLGKALEKMRDRLGEIIEISSVYETVPWGFESNHNFYNLAVLLDTAFPAEVLMAEILTIESALGRVRSEMTGYGDRVIDIDIIYFEDRCLRASGLHIPHPQRAARRFVLVPLAEIAPDFIDPEWGIPIQRLLKRTPDLIKLKKISGNPLSLHSHRG